MLLQKLSPLLLSARERERWGAGAASPALSLKLKLGTMFLKKRSPLALSNDVKFRMAIVGPVPPPGPRPGAGHHPGGSAHALPPSLLHRAQCYVGLALLIATDRLLKAVLAGVPFPAPLIGMFVIIAALVGARRWGGAAAPARFFAPAVAWVAHKWLPCFYAPALVTLPLALGPLPPKTLGRAAAVVAVGIVAVCAFTARTVMAIRAVTKTEYEAPPGRDHDDAERAGGEDGGGGGGDGGGKQHPGIAFTKANWLLWGGIAALSTSYIALALPLPVEPVDPAAAAAATAPADPFAVLHGPAPFALLLSSTILGYLGGMALPEGAKRAVHPIIATALLPNAVAAALGAYTGLGYTAVLRAYLAAKTDPGSGAYGPGDMLFSFLGVIILCFGFKVYEQWPVLLRHRFEVLGGCAASAAFSLVSTAALARGAGVPSEVARSLVPRGATLALALPIGERLGAAPQLVAASVALTGILGCNFVAALLTAFGARDPISRGLAAAATAHGLGTAAMAAREPEALPFAALAYALCGVSASVLATLPPFRAALLAILDY